MTSTWLIKTPVFPCHHDLVRTLGTGLGVGSPGGKKTNRETATEQVPALTLTVTGKPWEGQEFQLSALALLYLVLA